MTTNTHFETKEQYLAFRSAWADAVNSERAKSTLVKHEYYTSRDCGWLQSYHHILYNLLRNRDYTKGFTPITNPVKLSHGAVINHGLYEGIQSLNRTIGYAKECVKECVNDNPTWLNRIKKSGSGKPFAERYVESFLEPFAGSVTIEMLATIECPDIKPIYSDFGKGRSVAHKIINDNLTKITHQELWDLYEVA